MIKKKITQRAIALVHPFPSFNVNKSKTSRHPYPHLFSFFKFLKTTDCINDQTCTSPSFFKLNLKIFYCIIRLEKAEIRDRYILEFHYCLKRIFNGSALKRYVHIYIYFFASLTFIFLSEVFLLNSHIKFRDLLITFKAFVLKNSNDKGKNQPV